MNDEAIVLAVMVWWLLSREESAHTPRRTKQTPLPSGGDSVLYRSGARIYDLTHDDNAHQNDLPGKQMTRMALLQLAQKAGFADPKLAAAIALAESGGVPSAIVRSSKEHSVGLWQINTLIHRYSVDDLKDPAKNAAAAFEISKGGTDWRPWAAYSNGAYRKFQTGLLAP